MTTNDLEPQAGPSGTVMLRDFLQIIIRRKWVILACIILSLTAAWIICKVTTPIYRSETLILVEEQKITQNYVQGITEKDFELRFYGIQKQILSSKVLGKVLSEVDVYPEIVAKHGQAAAIAILKRRVSVDMIDKVPGAKFSTPHSVAAFTISFVHNNPATAMEVTSRIASRFVEENLHAREEKAEATSEFFDQELQRAQSQLETKEDEIKRFKTKHMGELPQQVEANLRALDRLQSDLNAVNESIQRFSDRLALIEKGIQDYQTFGTTSPTLASRAGEPVPLFRRHKELKEKLRMLKAEFWDSYPEVLVTKQELRQVEEELVAQYGPGVLQPGEKTLDPYLQDLKKQQSETQSELAVLNKRKGVLQAEKKSYEERVERAPAVEQELITLTRDYDNMKRDYQTLLDKRLHATVAENLEKRQEAAQYRITEPANFPTSPDWPNVGLIMTLGFLIGCVTGVGIAVVQEQLNPQFRGPEDVEHVIGPQLLAVIPDFAVAYSSTSWKRLLPYQRAVNEDQRALSGNDSSVISWTRRLSLGRGELPFELRLVAKALPYSIVAEQYRVAATRLALVKGKEQSTIVVVSSALQGEGKTTTVVNLGYTLAKDLGKRTVLVDCDFKRPSLGEYLKPIPSSGLADCLRTGVSVDECLFSFPEVPCWIMPVGKCEDVSNELLKTDRLSGIFAQLRDRFEYILINAPPILPVADMNVLAAFADELLLVIRAGSTPRSSFARALTTLRMDKPIHFVLNGAGGRSLPHYIGDYQTVPYGKP